jgi:DNA-binding transcriptional LysR family regulator
MARVSDLAFFVAVAQAGSLTAAARKMDITTAAASKHLSALEDQLGVRLINRTTRRLSLTHEGEIYFESAKRILEDIEALEGRISSGRAAPKGLLRVNAPLGFGRTYIAPAVSEFAKRYPAVELQLTLSDRPLVPASEAIDVSIRFGEVAEARLIARRIAANRRLICASPAYLGRHGRPAMPDDLSRHSCLVLRQGETAHGVWKFTRGSRSFAVKVRGPLSSNDGEVVLKWALDGHGVLMRAEWDIAKYLRSGRLVLLLEDYALPPADVHAVYPERHNLSAKVAAFIEFLIERFEKHAQAGDRRTSW